MLAGLWAVGLLLVWLMGRPTEAAGLPTGVQVETNGAVPTFPDSIVFQFKATAANGPHFQSIDLEYRLEGDVATILRHQKLEPGGALQAEIKIDTHETYVPPGTRFNYYWRLTDDTGETYQTAAQGFVYQDTRYPFRELKKGLVTVRWYQGSAAFGQQALDKATSTIDRLSRLYKASPDLPINLTIYPDSRTMFTALPPNTQEWVGGQAVPELGTIVLAIGPNDLNEIGRSIPHEVSHQVVYQATRNPYNGPPKWLDEGLAVNNQDQVDGFLNQAFERARADHTLFSLRVLNGPFPTDSQQSFVAYGQSVQVVRYIIKKYGEGAIEKMLAAFKEGRSYDEIVGVGLGLSVDELDRQWKQSIGYPVPALPDPTPTPGLSVSPPTPVPPTVVAGHPRPVNTQADHRAKCECDAGDRATRL